MLVVAPADRPTVRPNPATVCPARADLTEAFLWRVSLADFVSSQAHHATVCPESATVSFARADADQVEALQHLIAVLADQHRFSFAGPLRVTLSDRITAQKDIPGKQTQ